MTRLHHDSQTVQPDIRCRRPIVADLSVWLFERGYFDSERAAILTSARETGSLETAAMTGHLDSEDREQADEILEASQPVVPFDDLAWLISPVPFRGLAADADFWALGPAIPKGAALMPPTRMVPTANELAIEAAAAWMGGYP